MKKLVGVLLGASLIFFTLNLPAKAEANSRSLLIVEVQTGSALSASEEFIEIYNQTEDTVNLVNYKIEYFSASSPDFLSPSRVINLSGTLYPNGRYLIATSNYLTAQANTFYVATLAKSGGHIRLVSNQDNQVIVHDVLGWGTAINPEIDVAAPPESGQSLQREIDSAGLYQDTDNNDQDFIISNPSPESNNPIPPPSEEPTPESTPEPTPDVPEPTEEPIPTIDVPEEPVLIVQITELLPNPGSPGTDADDEFIELYNPNDQLINLNGYRLESGKDFTYRYTIGDVVIAPHQYIVLHSKDTGLVLSNTTGRARLLHPNGQVLSETSQYDNAKDNESWSLIGLVWQWSTTTTPGQENILAIKPIATTSAAKKASTIKPKLASKKSSSAKPKLVSSKAAKPKKAVSPKNTNDQKPETSKPGVGGSVHPMVLAAVGLLALGYAIYEYRSDIANKLRSLRSHRKNRPTLGPTA